MTDSSRELIVIINGEHVGDLRQDLHGQLEFEYAQTWADNPAATPLSLSMPLAARKHRHRVIDPWLRGLLPDSEAVLERWGRRFGVSRNSPFALLRHVGEDVAGAAQFVAPDRLADAVRLGGVESVDEDYIENRLRVLRGDRAAWDDVHAPGQFSLAGAQAKFALTRTVEGGWGLPTGRAATTHIIKPPLEYLAHQEVNEHLCLRAAALLGLRSAHSEVMIFGDEPAIVLERYDREILLDGQIRRRHQEDFCQALGVQPDRKYQRDGGPGLRAMAALLREELTPTEAERTIEHLVAATAYNWVILGPDAHAKNYSLLLDQDRVEISPLYDISSVAAYPDRYRLPTMTMAMSVNGKYENRLIRGHDWRDEALALGLEPDRVTEIVHNIATDAPDALRDAIATEGSWVGGLDMSRTLVDEVAENARDLMRFLDPPAPTANQAQGDAKPTGRPFVRPYRKADGTPVKGYPNPRFRA